MPTSSQSMIADHFQGHFDEKSVESDGCWEVTRFCVSPELPKSEISVVSRELVKSAFIYCAEQHAKCLVGLCFPTMLRLYRRLDCAPDQTVVSKLDSSLVLARWDVDFSRILELYSTKSGKSTSALLMA